MIGGILKLAAFTYGPLLALFAFGILSRRKVRYSAVPRIAIAAPIICYLIDTCQAALFGQYQIGLEQLIIDGTLTCLGWWLASTPDTSVDLKSATA